jgi:hypothetical protein
LYVYEGAVVVENFNTSDLEIYDANFNEVKKLNGVAAKLNKVVRKSRGTTPRSSMFWRRDKGIVTVVNLNDYLFRELEGFLLYNKEPEPGDPLACIALNEGEKAVGYFQRDGLKYLNYFEKAKKTTTVSGSLMANCTRFSP